MNEMQKPLITIVVPVYNVESYLERCLQAVINQSYTNIEIILVNDGSTDSSGEICDYYKQLDERILVIHKKNGGLSSARNAGIENSHGEFITFVDSDDWIAINYCEYLYNIMQSNDADMAMCAHVRTSKVDNNLFEKRDEHTKVLESRDFLLKILKVGTQENVQYAWGKLYRNFKEWDLRFPVGLIDEDVPTTFKYVSQVKSVVVSNRPLYAYYENMESILRQKFKRQRFDLISVWHIIFDYASVNCDAEITEYCRLNVYRANFGVLCNICTKDIDMSDYDYISMREREVLKTVKGHCKELLKFPMPLSRKIVMIGMCLNYSMVKNVCKKLKIHVNV